MKKAMIMIIYASLAIVLICVFLYRDYTNREIKMSIEFKHEVSNEFGKKFHTYDRETITYWLKAIRESNHHVSEMKFDPNTSVGSIHISEAKGSIGYYMSNIYVDEDYICLNEVYSSNQKVRISKDDFMQLPRPKESLKNILGFYLKKNDAGLDY